MKFCCVWLILHCIFIYLLLQPSVGPIPTIFFPSSLLVQFRLNFVKLFWATPLWGLEISQISFRTFTDVPPTLPGIGCHPANRHSNDWATVADLHIIRKGQSTSFLLLFNYTILQCQLPKASSNKSYTGDSGRILFTYPADFVSLPTTRLHGWLQQH